MFSCWPSVCQLVRTSFALDNFSIYKRISFKFCICICTNNVPLGIVNGQISIIYHRVLALVNVPKNGFWPLVPLLIIGSIMMKLHKNARNNKSSILAYKFCHLRLSALALRLYTCIKS